MNCIAICVISPGNLGEYQTPYFCDPLHAFVYKTFFFFWLQNDRPMGYSVAIHVQQRDTGLLRVQRKQSKKYVLFNDMGF